jgi:hypothetical protein
MKKATLLATAFAVASFGAFAEDVQHGWRAEYWMGATNFDQPEGKDFQNAGKRPAGTVATLTRTAIEPVIDFDWGSNGSPCNPDEAQYNDPAFCCKWTGYLLAPETSWYTFDLTHWDDGFYFALYDVDDLVNPLAFDKFWDTWGWDKPEWVIPDVELEKGHVYFLDVRHYENEYGAHARLKWFCEDIHTAMEVLPESVMYVDNPLAPSGIKAVEKTDKVLIHGTTGQILAKGVNNEVMTVYNLQGAQVYSALVDGDITVAMPQGIYLVKIGSTTKKVTVK